MYNATNAETTIGSIELNLKVMIMFNYCEMIIPKINTIESSNHFRENFFMDEVGNLLEEWSKKR